MDRRRFLRLLGIAGAAAAIPWKFNTQTYKFMTARAHPFSQSPIIRKFITALPGLGPTELPLATKSTTTFAGLATDVYNLTAGQFTQQLHPDLPGPTRLYGYADDSNVYPGAPTRYLGGVIIANRNTPVLLYMRNSLPNSVLVPTDLTLMASATQTVGDLPFNRITTHLHGGHTPWFSDGTPCQWYDPTGLTGASFMNVPGAPVTVGTLSHYYPNDQGARLLWYHDHAMGLTRTNAYVGMASGFLLTDTFEAGLIAAGTLPDQGGGVFTYGIPLIIQEKSFVPNPVPAGYTWGNPGDLWYPNLYEIPPIPDFSLSPFGAGTGRWDWFNAGLTLPVPSAVPEFFGDTAMVNGGLYPFLNVTDRRFRFRILNASQARFWHLNLYVEDANNPGELLIVNGEPVRGPAMFQIGTEGGFMPRFAMLPNGIPLPMMPGGAYPVCASNAEGPFNLLLAPAERADVIIDFKGWAGASFILYNDAVAPFPSGDARNEYFTGDLDMTAYGGAPATLTTFGPNTRTIMRIVVGAGPQDTVNTSTILGQLNTALKGAFLSGEQPPLLYNSGAAYARGPVPYTGAVARKLTLGEDFDAYGRLLQRLGTTTQNGLNNQGLPTWGRDYLAPSTENPAPGRTEVWEIYNLTADTHPIHFHLVNVQIIQRAAFDAVTPTFAPIPYTARPPDPNELGWKETVRMNPGEVTTVIMKFDLPSLPTAAMSRATSPRTGGHEYVWHCHILEHEEHDMMRPLVVKGNITPAINMLLDETP